MLDARALFYAVLVSLLVALLSAALVQLTYFLNMQQIDQFDKIRLIRNVNSGIALLKSGEDEIDNKEVDLYQDGVDKIQISRKRWGLFSVGTSKAIFKKTTGEEELSKNILFGDSHSDFLKYALYVTDQVRSVSLVGESKIRGKAFLPKSGIKRGTLAGKGFKGDKLLYGEKQESKTYLPKLDWERIKKTIDELKIIQGIGEPLQNIEASFTDEIVVVSGQEISLEGLSIKGNVIIRASKSIVVKNNTQLEDVILVAPSISVEEGFSGSFQAFASNKIKVEKNCYLEYPTVLFLSKKDNQKDKTEIIIGENTKLEGTIAAYEKKYHKHPTHVSIEKNSKIIGEVFVKGSVDHRGEIWGSLSCKEFQVRSSTAVNNNYLMDGKIDRSLLPEYYSSPLIDGKNEWKITKYIR